MSTEIPRPDQSAEEQRVVLFFFSKGSFALKKLRFVQRVNTGFSVLVLVAKYLVLSICTFWSLESIRAITQRDENADISAVTFIVKRPSFLINTLKQQPEEATLVKALLPPFNSWSDLHPLLEVVLEIELIPLKWLVLKIRLLLLFLLFVSSLSWFNVYSSLVIDTNLCRYNLLNKKQKF